MDCHCPGSSSRWNPPTFGRPSAHTRKRPADRSSATLRSCEDPQWPAFPHPRHGRTRGKPVSRSFPRWRHREEIWRRNPPERSPPRPADGRPCRDRLPRSLAGIHQRPSRDGSAAKPGNEERPARKTMMPAGRIDPAAVPPVSRSALFRNRCPGRRVRIRQPASPAGRSGSQWPDPLPGRGAGHRRG